MNSADRALFEPKTVSHPGETVLEYLDFHGWSQRDLARRTGITPKTISEICNGKAPITPTTALAFENVFGRPARLWLNLQRCYEEAEARQRHAVKSREWADWVKSFPLKEMRKRQFSLPTGTSDVDAVLKFFGVSSPESWQTVWQDSAVAYRQTRIFKTRQERPSRRGSARPRSWRAGWISQTSTRSCCVPPWRRCGGSRGSGPIRSWTPYRAFARRQASRWSWFPSCRRHPSAAVLSG